MISPGTLVDAIVAKLQGIALLVTAIGDASRIKPYHYRFPHESSLGRAIHAMESPQILVAYRGTEPGSLAQNQVWKHRFSLYVRGPAVAENGDSYYGLLTLLVNGVPAGGDGQKMLYTEIHSSCYPADVPRIIGSADVEGIDFFELQLVLTEIGDA